ncbi:hypothetical protein EST38_g10173 [Candolleomyces aberdarensis]|uniref:Peroxin-3 n=1 Tax=Candolleomyces aberdarensis TaxID=2316362 RepID=A0A4Q2DAA2_9AGAR|nr:hypothetical protein EST38_g10173 [Candolleomyces aberdarensis]
MPLIPRPSRQTLTKSAGFVGGMYLAHTYIRDRLEEVKQKMEVEVQARENLKRRFHQTHDTTAYTILALLPTLSSQILEQMNVEELTRELQSRSSNAKRSVALPPPAPAPQPEPSTQTQSALPPPTSPSLASSIELVVQPAEQGASGESSSSSLTSSSFLLTSPVTTEDMSASIQSFSSDLLNSTTSGGSSSASEDASAALVPPPAAGGLQAPVALTDSLLSSSSSPASSSSADLRTKAELWNEVKMLTLTRTLTTLYTSTLLSLLTTLQLTLLARSKYAQSVLDEAHAESIRERMEDDMPSLGGLVVKSLVGGVVSSVGAKVSLKTKLSLMDLHRLVGDVRRRVEHEVTFEGNEKRTNFLSSLLPSTPETIHHALVQGGFIPPVPSSSSPYPTSSLLASYHLNPESPHEQPVYSSQRATNDTSEDEEAETTTLESSQLSESNSVYWTSPPPPPPARGPAAVGGVGLSLKHTRDDSSGSSKLSSPSSRPNGLPKPPNPPVPKNGNAASTTSNPYPHISSDSQFLSLLAETRELVESADFARVLEGCLDRGVECLVTGLEKNVFVDSGVKRGGSGEGGGAAAGTAAGEEEVRIRLAGVLPGLARWSQLALGGVPSELVDNLLDVREVQCLSAIVFGKFEEKLAGR